MNQPLKIATCQFPVSGDMAKNARFISRFMRQAADAGAHLVHFPETALSGYAHLEYPTFDGFDWQFLEARTREIIALAENLNLWVVLGSCQKTRNKPTNCLHVISNQGRVVGTYHKRNLAGKELLSYSPGKELLVIDIHGMKCGFLICYDSWFPSLYDAYRKRGVRLLFHSYYSVSTNRRINLEDLSMAQLRTRAADHQMWISASNSSSRHSFLETCVARPDGSLRNLKRHAAGIMLYDFPDTEVTEDALRRPL